MSLPINYEKIAESRTSLESSPSVSDDESDRLHLHASMKNLTIPATVHWLLDAILVITLVATSVALAYRSSSNHKSCVRTEHSHSPIVEAGGLDAPLVDHRFIGPLFYRSPFKGPPNSDVEKAWQSIMEYGMIRLSEEDVLNAGQNLSAAQFPPQVGGGYIGAAVGTHQLHCLHYVWQDHHLSYFSEMQSTKMRMPEMYERHYEHCVDYIRQSIMCNFDPQILTYNWVRSHQSPTPNGNAMHKCVDWTALMTHLEKGAVELPEDFEWHQPADAQPWNENP